MLFALEWNWLTVAEIGLSLLKYIYRLILPLNFLSEIPTLLGNFVWPTVVSSRLKENAKVKWFCKGHGSVFLSFPTSALLNLPTPLLLSTLPSCSYCITPERCWWYITWLQPRCNMWCLSQLRGVSSTKGFVTAISQRHSVHLHAHNYSVFPPYSEKENTVMKPFPWRFYMQICAYSDYGNIKLSAPFFSPVVYPHSSAFPAFAY